MKESRQKLTLKINQANVKVNRTNIKVNGAFTQSRPSGILCALAHGKLCFLQQTIVFAAKNHLPRCFTAGGRNAAPKSCVPQITMFLQAFSIRAYSIYH